MTEEAETITCEKTLIWINSLLKRTVIYTVDHICQWLLWHKPFLSSLD